MNPLAQSKNITILPVLIALTLVCFALAPATRAVLPAPDGAYSNEIRQKAIALFSALQVDSAIQRLASMPYFSTQLGAQTPL
jgi:hypothetical protein